ncbi:hypothetical protein JB92DRAFT_2835379 [Gautieria morchelliformis]|nr:hypothetical protein JB92DRAFT_2835379 [Gautieria morchelliformis]
MVAAYETLPSAELEQAAEFEEQPRPSFVRRLRSVSFSCDGASEIIRAHADALDAAWLTELDRLGAPVFLCFMLLRLGLLSLSIFWGFLLVSPFWCISLVSNERFLPSAIQTGLIVTFIIILEPVPFVPLMRDARSKIYHILYAAYLTLAWRQVCVFLVPGEALGQFVARTWWLELPSLVAEQWDGQYGRVWRDGSGC